MWAMFKPGWVSLVLFIFLMMFHILGTYSSAYYGGTSDDVKLPPFYETTRFDLDPILGLVFYWIWLVVSAPLLVIGRIIIWVLQYLNIVNLYDYLNRTFVFAVFVVYYYFLASAISHLIKNKGH